MNIVPVQSVLEANKLSEPQLAVLRPDADNYSVLLLQPAADVEADPYGVRNRDIAAADSQFGTFLNQTFEAQPDLAVTPEYSIPWRVLTDAIKSGRVPAAGKLWAFGCESIKYDDLKKLQMDLSDSAVVLFERLNSEPDRFTDPLAYIFKADAAGPIGDAKTVILVQFKNHPMSDDLDFEVNLLHRGHSIYEFGRLGQTLRLISLVCSDVLGFSDADARRIYDRSLIIHIQLNAKPREAFFRSYRDRLMQLAGDQTEIVCLNWAENAQVTINGQQKLWNNISASAWYLKSTKFDECDATLTRNHKSGLYYTWCFPIRAHTLFFNFVPSIFHLTASKVAHLSIPAVQDHRRGPQVTKAFGWDSGISAWQEREVAPSEFESALKGCGPSRERLIELANRNPFETERVLALCAGDIQFSVAWYLVRELDPCRIDQGEAIQRITFCQDPDPQATRMRNRWLMRCDEVCRILSDEVLPPSIDDLKGVFQLEWSAEHPHQNMTTPSSKRATVMYLGDASESEIDRAYVAVARNIHRCSDSVDQSLKAQQRIVVFYRKGGTLTVHQKNRLTRIDEADSANVGDVTRAR